MGGCAEAVTDKYHPLHPRVIIKSTESLSNPFRAFYMWASVFFVTKSPPERTAFIAATRGFRQIWQAQPVPHYMALTRPCKFRIYLGCSQCRYRAKRHRRISSGWYATERAVVCSTRRAVSRRVTFKFVPCVLCASVFFVIKYLHSSKKSCCTARCRVI